MPTTSQFDRFEDEVNRLGLDGAIAALGFRGERGYEALVVAFDELSEADAAQALRVLAMAR